MHYVKRKWLFSKPLEGRKSMFFDQGSMFRILHSNVDNE